MKTLIILTILCFIESGLCFIPDIEKAIKGGRRSFDFHEYPAIQRLLDNKFQGFLSRRDSVDKKRNEGISFDEVASKTFFKSSGFTADNTTVIKVTTVPSVDTFWLYHDYINRNGVFTRGEVITNTDTVTTTFTIGAKMRGVLFCILGSDFVSLMYARQTSTTTVMSGPLSNYTDLVKGPFNVSLGDDGTFEYDFISSEEYPEHMFGAYVTNYVSNGSYSYMDADNVDLEIEPTTTQGRFHATGNIGAITTGKQYWVRKYIPRHLLSNSGPFSFVGVMKRVLIEEEENQTENDFVTLNFGRNPDHEPIKLTENFEYGGMWCLAAGHPVPTVQVFKGEQQLSSTAGSCLQLVSYAFVSFEGQSLNNVTGTYKCKATSGTLSDEREYVVEKYEPPN